MAQVIAQTFNVNLNLSDGQIALLNSDGTYTIDNYDAFMSAVQSGSIMTLNALGIALVNGDIISIGGSSATGSISLNSGVSTISYIKDSFDSINMTKEGVIQAPELIEEEIFIADDGAKFLKIFSHNTSDGDFFKKATTGAKSDAYYCTTKPNLFSRLGDIPKYKSIDGKYEFIVKWPGIDQIPNGYDQLEYIQSDGNQRIDTGVTSVRGYDFEVDVQFISTGTRQLMGFNGSTTSYFGMRADNLLEQEGYVDISGLDRHLINHITCQSNKNNGSALYVDGNFVKNCASDTIGSGTYHYFNLNVGGFGCTCKFYSAKVRDFINGIHVKDFVPVKRRSDGAIGLYDLINNVFHGNIGSGSFTAGPIVKKTFRHNRWKQESNPLLVNADATMTAFKNGFENVHVDYPGHWFYGMGRSSSSNSFLDIEAGSGDWWYAIGQNTAYQGGLTGPRGIIAKAVELYIRVDNTDFKEGIKFQDSLKPMISDNVFVNASASMRPLSYIEGLGTGYYIDTGWVPTSIDFKVECNFVLTGTTNVDQTVFGVGGAICSLNTMPSDAYTRWQFGCAGNWINVTDPTCTTNKEITAICESKAGLQTLTINDKQLATANYTTQSANSQPVYLYINNKDTDDYNAGAKLCYFKAWENGELVRDMIPVMVNMSMAGWYDKITDEFKQYYQIGIGSSDSPIANMGDIIHRDAVLIVNEIVED